MPEQLPPEVLDEPPATRLVYLAITGEVHDQDSLVDATGLSKRRIRDVANDLVDKRLINTYRNPDDQRRRIYYDPSEYNLIKAQQEYMSQL
ncbi:PaaX domain-containing protein [Natrinema ejinorense]|uniref:PaaX domain-containing protein n=1 Tax=Natrinema ejinorense TaxID=373386 RepID=A0A2A5QR39_9EURY|nr:PaaX domain-containing protein [Natrinema ejinorense]PCR89300.1 PaaX domain-containing protein [Natrinema ejinorense]